MARPWQHCSPSSAAQPALASDGVAQLSSLPGDAEQLSITELSDDTSELIVGFYNVGIQLAEINNKCWKRKEDQFKQDIIKAFVLHDLHMLCLSELGELGKGIGGGLPTPVRQWMSELLADSAVQPVSIYAGAHYLTIVKDEHVMIDQYKLISASSVSKKSAPFNTSKCVLTDPAN